MIIKTLKINNLRNIRQAGIGPSERLSIFHGPNGAGKTTVLESLVVLAKGRSFRTGTVASLVGPEEARFRVVADLAAPSGETHRLGLERGHSDWRARIDGADANQLSDLAAHLPVVLMEPNSHLLVSGAPEVRRRFVDWGVFHVKHRFLEDWRRYHRALRQRNAALRMGQAAVVRSLDPQLLELAAVIDEQRRSHLLSLAEAFSGLLGELSPDLVETDIHYHPGWREHSFEQSLGDSLGGDLERGFTSVGPHRADLVIRSGGKVARDRLSRGEQKIVAASLILAQARLLEQTGVHPALLLDDLASEFDADHLRNVVSAGLDLRCQLFVTGTTLDPYNDLLSSGDAVFHVKQGVVGAPKKP